MSHPSDAIGRIRIEFPVKFTVIVTIGVLLLSGVHWALTDSLSQAAVFLAAASAAGGTIVTAFYTGRTLSLFISQQITLQAREFAIDELGKKERAFAFAERWNNPSMYHVQIVLRSIIEMRGKPEEEVKNYVESNKTNVIQIFNFLEELAFAVEHDLVDKELVQNQFSGIVVGLWQIAEPWIKRHREARGRPKIWEKVEETAKAWH